MQSDNAKLKAEIAGLREMAHEVSQAKLATEHKIAMGALESENSALQKEIVQLRSRVADLESELLAVTEKTTIVPQKVVPPHVKKRSELAEVFINSKNEIVKGGDNPNQGSESPVSDDDGGGSAARSHVNVVSYEDSMTPPMVFYAAAQNDEFNNLILCLQDRDRELSELQKAVKKVEMERASAEDLTCSLKDILLLQEHFKNEEREEDISPKILVAKLLNSLEAEKESCRRMEVENIKLRGQVRTCEMLSLSMDTHTHTHT